MGLNQGWTMAMREQPIPFFNYQRFDTRLLPDYKGMKVILKDQFLGPESLFELESLMNWLSIHVEVQFVLFESAHAEFGKWQDYEVLENMNKDRLTRYYKKLRKVTFSCFYLPQTIIMNLGKGCDGFASEFILGADIRLAEPQSKIKFSHLERGICPQGGSFGLLSLMVGHSQARKFVLSGFEISDQEALSSGLISRSFREKEENEALFAKIKNQAPMARIQAKRSFLETILPELDRMEKYEPSISAASLKFEDWKQIEKRNFTKPLDVVEQIQKSKL